MMSAQSLPEAESWKTMLISQIRWLGRRSNEAETQIALVFSLLRVTPAAVVGDSAYLVKGNPVFLRNKPSSNAEFSAFSRTKQCALFDALLLTVISLQVAMRYKVAKVIDLKPGQGRALEVNGRAIALFNVRGEFFAVEDICTHMGAPLSNGMLAGRSITCEWHGASFDLKTGEALNAPAKGDVTAYKVFVEGDDVEIEID